MDKSYLLRLTAFAGLFFASAVVIGDGAGAGDEGGGAGGDDGGAGDEGGAEDGGADDSGEGGGGSGAGEEDDLDIDAEDEVDVDDEDTDLDDDEEGAARRRAQSKKNEAAVKKDLAEMAKTNPEGAKRLRKEFFQKDQALNNFTRAFRTPIQAREAAELLENSGGPQGVTEAIRDAKAFSEEINKFAAGDPELIHGLAQSNPQGLVAITPHAVEQMRSIDPQAFSVMQAKHMTEGFDTAKAESVMDRVMELIYDGKQNEAYAKAKEFRSWMDKVRAHGGQKLTPAGGDPRDKAIRDREAAADKKIKDAFSAETKTHVVNRINKSIEVRLKPYLRDALKRGAPLKLAQKQGLVTEIYSRIDRALGKDSQYQERVKGLMSEGDSEKVARYVGSKVDQIVKKMTRASWHSRGFAGGTPAKKAGTGAGAGGGSGVQTVAKKPPMEQIDWSKDPRRARYMSGEVTLLPAYGGKVVKFDWKRV